MFLLVKEVLFCLGRLQKWGMRTMPHSAPTHPVPEVGVTEQLNKLPNKPSGGKAPSPSDAHPELMAGCPLGGSLFPRYSEGVFVLLV